MTSQRILLAYVLITYGAASVISRSLDLTQTTARRHLQDATTPAASPEVGLDLCPHYEPGSVVEDPPILRSQAGILSVELAYRTSLDDNGNPKFCYVTPNNLLSPVLYVERGDEILLQLTNEVPSSLNITDTGYIGNLPSNFSVCPHTDRYLDPASTNLHFHGMEVTPFCGGDQVIHVAINPGESYNYTLPIPPGVGSGNYWYHPHLTGDTEASIQGGASGAVIVAGLEAQQPLVGGLPERIFMLRDQLLPESESNDSAAPAWDISINFVPVPYGLGYPPATIFIRPNEVQVWDITNAAADTIFNLQVLYDGLPQTLGLVSRDGAVARSLDGSGFVATLLNVTNILLGSAARAQFVLRAPGADVEDAQLVTLDIGTGPLGDNDPFRPVANIVLNGSRQEPELVYPGNGGVTPSVFALNQRNVTTQNRTLYFSEVLSDPSNPNSPTTFYLTQEADVPTAFYAYEAPSIIVSQGSVEEWLVENRAGETHVFHIHQLHFTVLEANNIESPFGLDQYIDTIVIPYWNGTGDYPSYRLLLDFTDIDVGEFVVHCHIAEHEDEGMTTPVEVVSAAYAH